ncbi:hypothetical protein PPGU19_050260 [Paraburkholderia sp. PGU19]|nr:hypothetical protein PPGU19_050260 [Paraburkholderia sp. PGU19]
MVTGAKLPWRVKSNVRLRCEVPLVDGSYLSTVYASDTDRRHQRNGMQVRVIEGTVADARMGAQAGGFSWSPAQHARRLSIVVDLVNRGGRTYAYR